MAATLAPSRLSRGAGRVPESAGLLIPDHPRWWGNGERRLDPPNALLRWLVANASPPTSDALWGSSATRAERERLVARDQATIEKALRLLESSTKGRTWYVLEGRSQPDACLETGDLIAIIEGKRTERKATSVTTWMRSRSQMLRHMDAAREISGGKQVLGLMIVEGPGGADAVQPSEHWLNEASDQVSAETLTDSLPHRDPEQRAQIAEGFLGVTTWQQVSAAFALRWPAVVDSV